MTSHTWDCLIKLFLTSHGSQKTHIDVWWLPLTLKCCILQRVAEWILEHWRNSLGTQNLVLVTTIDFRSTSLYAYRKNTVKSMLLGTLHKHNTWGYLKIMIINKIQFINFFNCYNLKLVKLNNWMTISKYDITILLKKIFKKKTYQKITRLRSVSHCNKLCTMDQNAYSKQ